MKATVRGFLLVILFSLLPAAVAHAQSGFAPAYQPVSADALGRLVGPVALYPDPLLAQVLQASTRPDQISQVAQLLRGNPDQSQLDNQSWNPAVAAVAHYPSVLNMMSSNPGWTQQLGLAYANQPKAVMQAIQSLRTQAQQNGNLTSNAQQTISTQGSNIVIVPSSPDVIYVPAYDPAVVYTQPAPSTVSPLVAFGAGMVLGDWMSSDCDWDNNVVVYHGWNGGWGHYYYGPYGPGYAARSASGTTARGGDWNYNAAAGRTWDGGAYAGRQGTIDTANGGTFGAYSRAGVAPDGDAARSRGWGYENGDDKAGHFSKTVVTDNGVYNVHGGGATNGDDGAGRVTVSGANRDGDYGSKTWTSNDGDRSSWGNSGNVFSGSEDGRWSSAASNRGFESRASSFGGGERFGGGSFGGGGFRGGGGGFRGGRR